MRGTAPVGLRSSMEQAALERRGAEVQGEDKLRLFHGDKCLLCSSARRNWEFLSGAMSALRAGPHDVSRAMSILGSRGHPHHAPLCSDCVHTVAEAILVSVPRHSCPGQERAERR